MIFRFYRVLQHLSIDIVFGAVILLHFFSKGYGISVTWPTYFLLGASIWLIYTIDHLRDSKRALSGKRERYVYHAKNERGLRFAIITVIIISVACLFFVQKPILIGGSFLIVLSLVYVSFQSRLAKFGLKEAYISIVYTLGILVAPISISQSVDVFLFFLLLILTFLNLIIFSWFEYEEDIADSFRSIATSLGMENLLKLILSVMAVGFSLGFLSIGVSTIYSIYLIVVLLVFAILIFNPSWAKQKGRYRAIGDAVFLLPVFFELL